MARTGSCAVCGQSSRTWGTAPVKGWQLVVPASSLEAVCWKTWPWEPGVELLPHQPLEFTQAGCQPSTICLVCGGVSVSVAKGLIRNFSDSWQQDGLEGEWRLRLQRHRHHLCCLPAQAFRKKLSGKAKAEMARTTPCPQPECEDGWWQMQPVHRALPLMRGAGVRP